MDTILPVGPYRVERLDDGTQVPFYIVPMSKHGSCKAPKTREKLLEAVRESAFTDVFLFSHGWNNDWNTASERYGDFVRKFSATRLANPHMIDREYRPLLVGIIWPSTSWIMPWEQAPALEAREATIEGELELMDVAGELIEDDEAAERLYRILSETKGLRHADWFALAELMAPLYGHIEDPFALETGQASVEELVDLWRRAAETSRQPTPSSETEVNAPVYRPALESGLSFLDPRVPLRLFTVWKMKDRAGKVGSAGVHRLLRDLLSAAPNTRVHATGHSFGCKVLLSAICTDELPRQVSSVLLLQPAVNAWSFARKVPNYDMPGAFRCAFERVDLPIMSTFTRQDSTLHDVYHWALRRSPDIDEGLESGGQVNAFAALGGYGPQGCAEGECRITPIAVPGTRYDLGEPGVQVLALEGHETITHHGDVVTPYTAWAQLNLVAGIRRPASKLTP